MLIQFSLRNFLSFKDEAVLDMSAIETYKEHEYNLITAKTGAKFIKAAAIYGANASGKSNIFTAFNTFQKIVSESFNSVPPGEKIPIHKYFRPFQFDSEQNNTELEIVLMINGSEYKYGFEYNSSQIVTEWLYETISESKEVRPIFERATTLSLAPDIQVECSAYSDQIPQETLVLTFLSRLKLKNPVFKRLYREITGIVSLTSRYYQNPSFIESLLTDIIDRDKQSLLSFLTAIDAGIKDIEYSRRDKNIYFCTSHEDKDGKYYKLPLYNESEGTIKSILVFIHVKKAIKSNNTVFIDELNAQLHPLLLKFIIDLFYDKNSRAQLIYTTHDTTLLDQRFFRRDQIWFVEKDMSGHSRLTSLAEFQLPQEGTFGINYLAGVYGAIPELKEFKFKEGD